MKFYVMAPKFDATDKLLEDIKNQKNVIYIKNPFVNKLINKLFFINMYRYKWIPLKKIWKYLFKAVDISNKNEENTCIIYFNPWIKFSMDLKYIHYIKKINPEVKHIAYLTDINVARKIDWEVGKTIFNEVYIFDKVEAEKLKLEYYPLMFSTKGINTQNIEIISDLSFVGQVKDRYEEIIKVFEQCKAIGVKCNFYLIGVDKKYQKYNEEIKYGNFIPPEESLHYILTTKCVLELKVGAVESYSDRVLKAIAYNKKILTNNINIKDNKYYREEFVKVYTDVKEIKRSFFDENNVEYFYKGEYSPCNFLKLIDNEIL